MDPAPIALGVLAINLGVFLGGCVLAAYRIWREDHPAPRHRSARRVPVSRPSH